MKNYKIKIGDRQFIVKAQDRFDAIKKLKDVRPDRDTVFKIERAANNIRSNNISVAVNVDADKNGVFIKEMYISTSGKWLETPQEADAYLRDLSNAIKFFKENYKYVEK